MVSSKNCHGCGAALMVNNDSAAHIIPKALGGRLAPKGLLCRDCNTKLDSLADNALIEAFGIWPTLLDINRQGKNPPKQTITKEGHKVRVEPDGKLTRTDIVYEAVSVPDGEAITIAAPDLKTLKQLAGRAKKKHAHLDINAILQQAATVSVETNPPINASVDFSPQAVFGGIVTILWLFILKNTGHKLMDWDQLVDCIDKMQKTGGSFRYLVDGLPGLEGPTVKLGHKIVVRSIPHTGELIAYVEILNTLKVGGLLAKAKPPSEPFELIYVYDLDQTLERSGEFRISAPIFESQNWTSVGMGLNESNLLIARITKDFADLESYYRDKSSGQ